MKVQMYTEYTPYAFDSHVWLLVAVYDTVCKIALEGLQNHAEGS